MRDHICRECAIFRRNISFQIMRRVLSSRTTNKGGADSSKDILRF